MLRPVLWPARWPVLRPVAVTAAACALWPVLRPVAATAAACALRRLLWPELCSVACARGQCCFLQLWPVLWPARCGQCCFLQMWSVLWPPRCGQYCCLYCGCMLNAAASAAACALRGLLQPELCGLSLVASAAFCSCTLYYGLRAVANAAACFGHCCRLRAAANHVKLVATFAAARLSAHLSTVHALM